MKSTLTTTFLWGVYPYLCLTLFFVVPVIRMIYRPFGFTTRASGLFNRDLLGFASLMLHWGLLLVFLGHLAGFVGGLLGWESWIGFFWWTGLIGGLATLLGCILALARRWVVPEVRAMSQWDDYLIHVLLIAMISVALYQVVVDRIFGVAYTASSWLATVIRLSPQPQLMDSASFLSQAHILLALTFFALFPFTKLVHLWTFPINYFIRPYQAMRTSRYLSRNQWEFLLRSDKSFLIYSLGSLVIFFGAGSLLLGWGRANGAKNEPPVRTASGHLAGMPLYLSQCARCHGVEGKGDGAGANSPTFATVPRDLTLGKHAFISTDNGVASDQDLMRTIRGGLAPAGMPAFAALDDRQIASLVAVTRRFAKEAGVQPGAMLTVPPRPPQANAKDGRELFVQTCAACHGESGRGDGPIVAAMRDMPGRPSPPRNLTKPEAYKAGTEPEQLYLRIAAGISPIMPPFRGAYKPEQIWSIVLYVQQDLMPPTTARK